MIYYIYLYLLLLVYFGKNFRKQNKHTIITKKKKK